MASDEQPRWRFVDESDLKDWLKGEGTQAFRYTVERAGLLFAAMVGMLGVILLAILWLRTGFEHANQIAGAVVPLVMMTWSLVTIFRWNLFAFRSWVLVTPSNLILGKGRKAVEIPRVSLDRQTVRFHEMKVSIWQSALPVVVGGERFVIHLTGPFANMKNHRTFLTFLLEDLLSTEGEASSDE